MLIKFTITKDIDPKQIYRIANKYYHGSIEDALDYYLDDNYSKENEEAVELIEDAIYKAIYEERSILR